MSVVIPVFDRQEKAERAIASALAQSVDGLEIIVVDDGSRTPFALPAAMADDERVVLMRHAANAGAASARNTGIAAARGEWIAFLDSDDRWSAGKLARQLAFAHDTERRAGANPLTCYATGFSYLDLGSGTRRDLVPIESGEPCDFASGCWFAPGSTALLRRETIARMGEIDAGLPRLEDLDWFLRLALAGGGLKVLPSIEAIIETGRKPAVAAFDAAIAAIQRKWLTAGSPLDRESRARLAAYLALEQASMRRHEGRWAEMALALGRSFAALPRASLQLRRWWHAPVD